MLKNIIGLGDAGCNIASAFEEVGNYICYKINADVEKNDPFSFELPRYQDPEEYEKNPPNMKKFFQNVKEPVLFIIGGSSLLSSATMVVLEHIKRVPIQILFIAPDRNFLMKQQQELDRLAYGALQEMTRSGLFDRMWIVSNTEIEKLADGIPIGKYYETINSTIASTFHAINIYSNTDPLAGSLTPMPVGVRISTFGFVNEKENEDCLYFPLDFISDKQYIYTRSRESLEQDKQLLQNIKKSTLQRAQQDENGVKSRASFIVVESETDFTYVMAHTSLTQEYE